MFFKNNKTVFCLKEVVNGSSEQTISGHMSSRDYQWKVRFFVSNINLILFRRRSAEMEHTPVQDFQKESLK